MESTTFWNSFSSAGRIDPDKPIAPPHPRYNETDIPEEWRTDLWESYGEVVEPLEIEESAAAELDRR